MKKFNVTADIYFADEIEGGESGFHKNIVPSLYYGEKHISSYFKEFIQDYLLNLFQESHTLFREGDDIGICFDYKNEKDPGYTWCWVYMKPVEFKYRDYSGGETDIEYCLEITDYEVCG